MPSSLLCLPQGALVPAPRSVAVLGPPAVHTTGGPVPLRPVPLRSGGSVREPVEVRSELVDGVPTPTQLLRGNRLWVVRWAEPLAGPSAGWRVAAAPGPGVPLALLELTVGDGRWSLVELPGPSGEPGWR
jgi:hypothetical protein